MTTLLRPKDVAAQYRISRRTIRHWLHTRPDFPKPMRPSPKVALFRSDELDRYFESKREGVAHA